MSSEVVFLLLDVGNTRVKWALVRANAQDQTRDQKLTLWLAAGACAHSEINGLLQEWDRQPMPDRVFGANVAGRLTTPQIETYWQQRGVPLSWARAQAAGCGVTNLYEQPEQLGVDRWAALVGAWNRQRGACLVVSAGTALTIDTLDRQGNFQGGMILPGRRLMQTSLADGTHALTATAGQIINTPRNTFDAIASGVAVALAAPVREAYARLAAACLVEQGAAMPDKTLPTCLLTGGDAGWLNEQLEIGCTIAPLLLTAPQLVLEGLLEMALEEMAREEGIK